MDARVDIHLGDSISVTLHDNTTHTIMAFVTKSGGGIGTEGTDPMLGLAHVKIDKTAANLAVLPNGPRDIKRLTTSRFAGSFKPAADTIDDDDRSWVFDLQKGRPL